LKIQTFVIGILLAKIYKLEGLRDQTQERFYEAVSNEIEELLPNYNFVICEDCWDDVFLEKVLVKRSVFIGKECYLVAIFERGRLTCKKKDLKGKTGKVRSSQGTEEDKRDSKVWTFAQRPGLDSDNEFKVAFDKLKGSIKNFDGLMNLLKTKLSNGIDETLKEKVKVEKTENGIKYIIESKGKKRERKKLSK